MAGHVAGLWEKQMPSMCGTAHPYRTLGHEAQDEPTMPWPPSSLSDIFLQSLMFYTRKSQPA